MYLCPCLHHSYVFALAVTSAWNIHASDLPLAACFSFGYELLCHLTGGATLDCTICSQLPAHFIVSLFYFLLSSITAWYVLVHFIHLLNKSPPIKTQALKEWGSCVFLFTPGSPWSPQDPHECLEEIGYNINLWNQWKKQINKWALSEELAYLVAWILGVIAMNNLYQTDTEMSLIQGCNWNYKKSRYPVYCWIILPEPTLQTQCDLLSFYCYGWGEHTKLWYCWHHQPQKVTREKSVISANKITAGSTPILGLEIQTSCQQSRKINKSSWVIR